MQDLMVFVEKSLFTLSTFVLVIVSPLYVWMIVQSIRNRLFISIGTSVLFYIVFVTDLYMEWIPDMSTNVVISAIVSSLPIWIPAVVYKAEEELRDERDEDDEGTPTILVQEEVEFHEYIEEVVDEKKNDKICIVIEGKNCRNVPSLFREFAYMFEFPDDFNESWDTFGEYMNDLHWLAAERCTVYIHNSDQLLQGDTENFNIFMGHLGDACITWDEEREVDGFCMVMHCTPGKEEGLIAKLEAAKSGLVTTYEQEEIEIIYDVHALEGTNYIEILPGEGEIEYWSESSIFFTEENFGYIMPTFEKCCKKFNYYGVNEIRIHTWNEILTELDVVKQYLMNHPEPHSVAHVVDFVYDGVEEAFMQDYDKNRNQLITMITEFQAWIEDQSKTTKVISVLGI